jgi:uncharacterized protein (TIGR02246 family)
MMKGETVIVKRCLIPLLLICFSLASPCLAQQEPYDEEAEVKALLERHEKAFVVQDLKGVMETYASDSEIVLMGTGPGEVYLGKEGIEAAYSRFFNRFEPGTLSIDHDSFFAHFRCDVAWFAVECRAKAEVNKKVEEMALNLSGTLVRQEDKWQFTAVHFSGLAAVKRPAGKRRR